jgi:hypothetical protein
MTDPSTAGLRPARTRASTEPQPWIIRLADEAKRDNDVPGALEWAFQTRVAGGAICGAATSTPRNSARRSDAESIRPAARRSCRRNEFYAERA